MITGYIINEKHLFLTVLQTRKFKIKTLADLRSDDGLFLVQVESSCCVLVWWKG